MKENLKTIELLAPAKNKECGMAAIDHGADAVYIGADRFGARSAAGNSVADIHELCIYAHKFGCKIYVTVNTIIYDDETEATHQLIWQLYDAGVDAILVQDMGILKMDLPPIALHASTQTDNRTAAKVAWLGRQGFRRVVLARELSADEIRCIHQKAPDIELEVFVHGALCVSYSGVCYASQYCFGRSANRGECAQFCRLKFNLTDSNGKEIVRGRHLLSLKDMSQYDELETLLEAGASSFKIEGRLKDIVYVKNVVAAYSERLNQIIALHPNTYQRASRGKCIYDFTPNLNKTFNRGFTHYFLHGRQPGIASFDTPKALGECVGKVKDIQGNSLVVTGTSSFANGDGLCFINASGDLEGFRVNRAENNRLFPLRMLNNLYRGTILYRNNDQAFERLLTKQSARRRLPLKFVFSATADGFALNCADVTVEIKIEKQLANNPQRENLIRQLSKLGGTIYECISVEIEDGADRFFIPSSMLADMRRKLIDKIETKSLLTGKRSSVYHDEGDMSQHDIPVNMYVAPQEYGSYPYMYNISNKLASAFYAEHGMKNQTQAYELHAADEALIMQCRHCLRYALGYCVRNGGEEPSWYEPLYLSLPDGRRFRLQFNCSKCQMNIYAASR